MSLSFSVKTLLVIVALAGTRACLFAQGTVNLANSPGTAVTNALTGYPVAPGTNFMVALYYLPDMETAPGTTNFDTAGVVLAPSVGFGSGGVFNGGIRTTPAQTPPGGYAYFQVRGWETAFGTTYQQAVANPTPINNRRALAGTSTILRVNTGNEQFPASLVAAGLQGFYLVPLPTNVLQITDFTLDAVITFPTVLGQSYAVDKTTGLNPVNWQPLAAATNMVGTGGLLTVRDIGAGCLDDRHYRVRVLGQ